MIKVRQIDRGTLELNSYQSAIWALVNRYLARQVVVCSALKELRPDILILAEGKRSVDELLQARASYAKAPQSGLWGKDNEWRYFVHGKGCKLTHIITNEPLEWDAPDLTAFDKWWFVNYLEWLIRFKPNDASVRVTVAQMNDEKTDIRESVFEILEQLLTLGLLA